MLPDYEDIRAEVGWDVEPLWFQVFAKNGILSSFETWAYNYHYGDPPRHGCVGDSMNCIDVHIVEAWENSYNRGFEWVRNPEIEKIGVAPKWSKHAN